MYLNGIYICISSYSKICWFPIKKCWCKQNSRYVGRDSYSFWIILRYNFAKFHHCRMCVTDFRQGGDFFATPPIRERPPKKPSWIRLRNISAKRISSLSILEKFFHESTNLKIWQSITFRNLALENSKNSKNSNSSISVKTVKINNGTI